jgi:hypothetical protein
MGTVGSICRTAFRKVVIRAVAGRGDRATSVVLREYVCEIGQNTAGWRSSLSDRYLPFSVMPTIMKQGPSERRWIFCPNASLCGKRSSQEPD